MNPTYQPLHDATARRSAPLLPCSELRLPRPLCHVCQVALEPVATCPCRPLLFLCSTESAPISLPFPLCFGMEPPSTPLLRLLRPCESHRNRALPPPLRPRRHFVHPVVSEHAKSGQITAFSPFHGDRCPCSGFLPIKLPLIVSPPPHTVL
jgi:hypothetical protein